MKLALRIVSFFFKNRMNNIILLIRLIIIILHKLSLKTFYDFTPSKSLKTGVSLLHFETKKKAKKKTNGRTRID